MGRKIKITESFENVHVWGISTALPILKLVLLINKSLHVNFRRSIKVMSRSGIPPEGFQTFTYLSETYDTSVRYVLFMNRMGGHALFSSCNQFDYLLVVLGSFSSHELKRTTMQLRSVDGINALIPIAVDTLKQDRELFLLFD
ncbi:MAG: hypothetical protein WHT29_12140 [Bacteroidales bacterium]